MKVYLFSDYLKTIHGSPLSDDQVICEVETISDFPDGLCEINGKTASLCMLDKKLDNVFIKYVDNMPMKKEVSYSEQITCPNCGSENTDSWEAGDSSDDEYCSTCGSVFSYDREVSVTYNSRIVSLNSSVTKLNTVKALEK